MMKCKDCAYWEKSESLSKDWRRCSNPKSKTYKMWMEDKNEICKVGKKTERDEYYAPGGGRLLMERDLTDEEREEYVSYFARKGIKVRPEDVVVESGVITIKNISNERKNKWIG